MTEVFEDAKDVPLADPRSMVDVLVVAADPELRKRFEGLPGAAEWRMRTVACGGDALAALEAQGAAAESNGAAIVILDGELPDGEIVCRAIRQQIGAIRVYLILLVAEDAEAAVASAGGPDDYLNLRSSAAELSARLRTAQRILGLERSLRELTTEQARLVTVDALTNTNNRAYFMRHLHRDLEQVRRFGGMLSVLVLDVDHFKRINDRYGHAAGDEVLQELSRRVGASLRDCDWYARVGDEEFAIVLPQTPSPGARILAERIRRQISVAPVATGAGAVAVSVSIGVSGLEAFGPRETATIERLFALACRCVHHSKVRGRDCVTVPEDLTARGIARR